MSKPWVCIVMGSDSDAPVMAKALEALDEFGIAYEFTVTSAHRTPERTREIIESAERDGARVFIAGAGGAAHLPGVVASLTTRPVIGVPLEFASMQGLDSLLSIVQMPGGMPVATVAIGNAGAKNAGILAAQILATGDDELAAKIAASREKMKAAVVAKAKSVEKKTTSR